MAKTRTGQSICAVVVTYQPDLVKLRSLLDACLSQVACLVVVDNGSDSQFLSTVRIWCQDEGFVLIEAGDNLGVASAHNRGVVWARAARCSHVILFDQDSVPASDMVDVLSSVLHDLQADCVPVAAVGPRLVDRRSGLSTPFVRIRPFGVTRIQCDGSEPSPILTDFIVSSGMLIPLEMIDRVGAFDESLFIDNVDLEWCFRARHLGLSLYGVGGASMDHSVGDRVLQIRSRVVHLHSPIRQYYIMRNRIALYSRDYIPWEWVIQDFLRLLVKFSLFSLLISPRRQNLRMMLLGVWHGVRGKSGKFS